jgi:hypothetical protein
MVITDHVFIVLNAIDILNFPCQGIILKSRNIYGTDLTVLFPNINVKTGYSL